MELLILFLSVLATEFVAEMGDKTQLTAVTFGANYGLSKALIVWAACVIGFFAADILGMLAGLVLKKNAPENALKIISFVMFLLFGILTAREGILLF